MLHSRSSHSCASWKNLKPFRAKPALACAGSAPACFTLEGGLCYGRPGTSNLQGCSVPQSPWGAKSNVGAGLRLPRPREFLEIGPTHRHERGVLAPP
ncbi:hypothetical protein NDU88_002741 [Pleurodeles waltl]|uniref:Uncharacterized protein n=1 Tax=Pleurodeles waltl TaxID=8319 RepID=A0AAV7PG62_PLEWA|nr:hypothetical protein NDU88_002741 [Pleurodeles waltl]